MSVCSRLPCAGFQHSQSLPLQGTCCVVGRTVGGGKVMEREE